VTAKPARARLALGTLARSTVWPLRHTPGVLITLYGIQLALSSAAAFAIARILTAAFARYPVFDDAVNGDVLALIAVVREEPGAFVASTWVVLMVVAIYAVLSLFLTGGLIALLVARDPSESRREVAWRFGAGGAATLFPYTRLALMGLLLYAAGVILVWIGAAPVLDSLETATSLTPLLYRALARATPGLLVLLITRTVLDYARIELSRRDKLAAWRALGRGFALVFRHPWPIAHMLAYVIVFGAITAVAWDLAGAVGVLALFGIRQLAAAGRFVARVVTLSGQVAIARTYRP
jgi:hypothetical protein